MSTTQIPKIEGSHRPDLGSRHSARLRETGHLPAVIYGHKIDPAHVALDRKQVTNLLHHKAHLIEVSVDGHTEACLIKDVQWDHLGSRIIHVDLTRVDLTEKVGVEVEVEFVGEAVGLKEAGAYLEHPTNELTIQCLASQIPDSIKVDISQLQVGQPLTVADLALPQGVSVENDPESVIAVIHISAGDAEATAEAGEAEPEVIRKKDKPEDGTA